MKEVIVIRKDKWEYSSNEASVRRDRKKLAKRERRNTAANALLSALEAIDDGETISVAVRDKDEARK